MKGIEFYRDRKREIRWRVRARNGRIVGASSEGFASLRNARHNLRKLRAMLIIHAWQLGNRTK